MVRWTRRHFALPLLALAACGPAPEVESNPELSVAFGSDADVLVDSALGLSAPGRFCLLAEANISGCFYVFYKDGIDLHRLYPEPQEVSDVRIGPDRQLRVPREGWITLEGRAETEEFVVVVVPRPVSEWLPEHLPVHEFEQALVQLGLTYRIARGGHLGGPYFRTSLRGSPAGQTVLVAWARLPSRPPGR